MSDYGNSKIDFDLKDSAYFHRKINFFESPYQIKIPFRSVSTSNVITY